jgi:ABC-type nitrate/sulfonate/bicarbonate transport system permease component
VALAVVLALWQSGVFYSLFGLQQYTVPTPATIASTLAGNWSSIWGNQQTTLLEAVAGYLLGSAVGFGMAVLVTATGIGRRLLPGSPCCTWGTAGTPRSPSWLYLPPR